MTDAIEAGARALCKLKGENPDQMIPYEQYKDGVRFLREQPKDNPNRWPAIPLWQWRFSRQSEAVIEAAIASGALVPARAVAEMLKSKKIYATDLFGEGWNGALDTAIRQLDIAPAGCTHTNKFTRTKAGNGLTPESYCPDCDTVFPVLHAATRTGGEK